MNADEAMNQTHDLVENVVEEMKRIGLIGEDKLRIQLWMFVNAHTKILREFYGISDKTN